MKTALITGGSSGIGLEISKRFAKDGYKLCWVTLLEDEVDQARAELLTEFPDTDIQYYIQDLSAIEGAQRVFDWVNAKDLYIDVLINNAGFGTYGMSSSISMEKEEKMIHLNVLTVYKLTRLFLDKMESQKGGTIINVSSSTSFQPVPRMAAYSSTKAFVSHYSQSLQEELREKGSKVKVITVCPAGIKDTKFKVAAAMEGVKTFEGLQATTKKEVADDVWKGFKKGKTFIKSGARLRNTMWLTKILPKSVVMMMIKDELSQK